MRVAFFGGTFDPIHLGHIAIARAAAESFALDRVLFAPTSRQPLKSEAPISSFADRLAMVTLALNSLPANKPNSGTPMYEPSTLDAPQADGSPNFTVDTLTTLAHQIPGETLFAISGADSFLDLPRWRSPMQLLALAEWIVVSRPGLPLPTHLLELPQLAPLALTAAQRARIHPLETVDEDISATELRARLQQGDPCPGLLPPPVADYIRSHHLYR